MLPRTFKLIGIDAQHLPDGGRDCDLRVTARLLGHDLSSYCGIADKLAKSAVCGAFDPVAETLDPVVANVGGLSCFLCVIRPHRASLADWSSGTIAVHAPGRQDRKLLFVANSVRPHHLAVLMDSETEGKHDIGTHAG